MTFPEKKVTHDRDKSAKAPDLAFLHARGLEDFRMFEEQLRHDCREVIV
jgi:hypothetical protein